MRIRTQNALLITPIFLGLGVVTGILSYTSERDQVTWGLEREAASLGIAIAEFIDVDAWQRELASGDGLSNATAPLASLIKEDQIKHLTLHRRRQNAEWAPVWQGGDTEFQRPPASAEEFAAAEEDGNLFLTGVEEHSSGNDLMTALVPIHDKEKAVVGMVEVSTDARALRIHTNELVGLALRDLGILGLVGFILSGFISWLFQRPLNRLNDAIREVASGDYDQRIAKSTIQELSDLGNTFNTMSSVLRDVLSKTRQELIEAEQFRATTDLAETCHLICQEPVRRDLGGREVLLQTAGNDQQGCFIGCRENDGSTQFILGRVNNQTDLEAALIASAAQAFLVRILEQMPPDFAIAAACDLFDFAACLIVTCHDDGRVERAAADARNWPTIESNSDELLIFASAGSECERRVRAFINLMGDIDPDEIDLLLTDEASGAILVIEPATAAAAATSDTGMS